MGHFSIWKQSAFLQYDCVVVGGGITGLSTAISLKKMQPKLSVAVLERGFVPAGASTRNAGFACFGSLSELVADAKNNGTDAMVNLVERRWQGLKKLRENIGDNNIKYHQHGGYELIFPHQSHLLDDIEWINHYLQPVFKNKNAFVRKDDWIAKFKFNADKVAHLIYTPFEGQIDAGFLMRTLLNTATRKGIFVATGTVVQAVNESDKDVELNVNCGNQKLKLKSKTVAICCNAFTNNLLPDIKITPGRGQVVLTSPLENMPICGNFHFDEGFYYFRNYHNRILLGGGRHLAFEEEKTQKFGNNPKITQDLTQKLQTIVLPNQKFGIDMQWSGIMGFTPDKNPIIEQISKRIFAAAGLSGMGIAIGSLVGEELSEKIVSKL